MSGAEQRKSPRIERSLPIVYANLSLNGATAYRYYSSAIIDLSEGGIGMEVEEAADKGDLLQIVLNIPVKPFMLTGLAEAMWVKPANPPGRRYRVGLRFVKAPMELTDRLVEQLNQVGETAVEPSVD
jgi:Tfp pilus assembly protein PilZ